MITLTSALLRSFPCRPPSVTLSAMSLPSFRLVAPVSTSGPPVQSPRGLISAFGYAARSSSVGALLWQRIRRLPSRMYFPSQPFHVFPVDDVDVGRGPQRCLTLLGAAYHHAHAQEARVLPGIALLRPDRLCHTERRDHQHLPDVKAVEHQVQNGRERDCTLTEAHFKDQHGFPVRFQKLHAVVLVPKLSRDPCGLPRLLLY